MEIVIGGIIAIYAGFVIYKKIKDAKAGNFCGGSCGNCSSEVKCKVK
ncbi:MAG: FeoB-associated Cys-rich rane protein [Lachnospiraceae bacterium]|jgi:hypothetical protein|nr:FeoB-associated Cys-rich rane protein [Lachnospiraceae bacterium]